MSSMQEIVTRTNIASEVLSMIYESVEVEPDMKRQLIAAQSALFKLSQAATMKIKKL